MTTNLFIIELRPGRARRQVNLCSYENSFDWEKSERIPRGHHYCQHRRASQIRVDWIPLVLSGVHIQ